MSQPVLQHSETATAGGKRDRGLLLIGLFKLAKSLFFFAVGVGTLHLLHSDLGNEAMRLVSALHFDVEGRFVAIVMEKIDLIDTHHLRAFDLFFFAYSAIALVEGIGLVLCKVWAEYLTLGLTIAFLPWELYEIIRQVTPTRVGLLGINLAVLGYILWLLDRKKKNAAPSAQ